jgi:site-specific DNA-methyltransferase (adenine-specific)
MDRFSFASEIAMQLIGLDYGVKLDDILCDPEIVDLFDRTASELAPGFTPFEYRWAALTLRKRAKKSNELAKAQFQDWLEKPLPRSVSFADAKAKKLDGPAVYIISQKTQHLYVGETLDLRARIESIEKSDRWTILEPTEIRVIRSIEPSRQHGLQAILVRRLNPLLNSRLLRPTLAENNEPRIGANST